MPNFKILRVMKGSTSLSAPTRQALHTERSYYLLRNSAVELNVRLYVIPKQSESKRSWEGKLSSLYLLKEKLLASGCMVFDPGSEGYDRTVCIWNRAVDRKPALVTRCTSATQVQSVLLIAQEQNIEISVRAGGHDWAGRSLRDGGLVIDVSGMRSISVDPEAREATVAAGATSSEVCAATARFGLTPVTGNVGAVGFVGLLIGGGYGPLTPRYGLAADNLIEAEVVLADGRIFCANAKQNADLFWGIQGGGGNLGVVTSVKVRIHEVDSVLSGPILFSWSEAPAILRGYAEIMATAPDELFVAAALASDSQRNPVVVIVPTWSGAPEEGQRFVDRLQNLGNPIARKVGVVPYGQVLTALDDQFKSGLHYAVETRWLADLTREAISTFIDAYERRTSPLSTIAFGHFHGTGTRIAADATAFGLRKEHFLALAYSTWDPALHANNGTHAQWVADLSSRLKPFSLPGGYANVLASDAREQIANAYGGNAARLLELKKRFDPLNVFSSTIPLPTRV